MLGQHEEYQTLYQACDLVIRADQEHSVRQENCLRAQNHVYTSPLEKVNAEQIDKAQRDVILHKAEMEWTAYRQQTDTEVHRLLASLANKQL